MFAFNLDCNDGNCSGLFYPRRIGRAPRGYPDARATASTPRVPQQTKILGAAKLTGRPADSRSARMNATTADEQAIVANGTLRTRQSVEPLSNFSVVRARREFANQSSLGFMATAHDAAAELVHRIPAGPGLHRRRRLGPSDQEALRAPGLLGRQLGARQRARDPAAAGKHGPQLPAARRGPRRGRRHADVAQRQRRPARHQQDRRIEGPLQLERQLQVPRLRHQRRRLHAPRRHALDEQLDAVPQRHAVEVPAQLPLEPQSVGRPGTSAAIGWISAATSTRTGPSPTSGARGRASPRNAAPSTIAPRAAWVPARSATPPTATGATSTPTSASASASTCSSTSAAIGYGTRYRGIEHRRDVPPDVVPVDQRRSSDWNHNVQDAQWVENTADGRYVFGRLDQTTVS